MVYIKNIKKNKKLMYIFYIYNTITAKNTINKKI